jgi:thiamine kinase-like enzyme
MLMVTFRVHRTLDGGFMTPQWLEQCVFPHGGHVQARRVVPGSIRKGKHSIVAKLEVDVLGSQSVVQTKHVFLKRYVQEELPPRAARNWTRDLISYRCEARFYESVYPHLVLHPSASIGVIKPLHVQFRIDSSGRETGDGFLVLLENVVASTPLEPADRLTREDTQHALKYLAGLHAASMQSPELLHQVKTYLWPSGTWWSFEKRGVDELRHAPVIWKRMLEAFHQEIEASGLAIDSALKNLGERMVEHAAYISDQLFGEPSDAYAPLKTLVHGDFKTGNLFFHADTREVTAFDWQWAGLGLGALDVANLLNTSVGIEALADEEGLLRFYYDAFQQALRTGTVDLETLYPFEAFTRHVDLATLEYARVLIANFWDDTTPASCVADAHKTNWGLGYRSVPHVLRLVHKLHHGLARFAQEQPAAVE